jgi:DNA-binding SARP family transcriptional activator
MVVDAADVRFSVLGPVRAWRDGHEVALGSPQQCAVLGLLLLGRGRPIGLEALVDQVWGDATPVAARATVRTYLSRLRRALPALGDASLIESGRGGYALPVPGEALDLAVFEDRLAMARVARTAGNSAEAAGLLRAALELWRGPALAGARGQFVERERARLDQLRLVAVEERIALDLDLGRHGEVLVELAGLVMAYPLQERLRELQMLALYRCGRQADALEVFRGVWALLDRELGIEPGSDLRALHERILRADPGLDPGLGGQAVPALGGSPTARSATGPAHGSTRSPGEEATGEATVDSAADEESRELAGSRSETLPDAVARTTAGTQRGHGVVADRLQAVRERGFVGRVAERELFASALADGAGAFVTLFLHGPGGVGKSTLARRLADDATAAGRTVLRVDGRAVGSSTRVFTEAVGPALGIPGVVLLIDTFEQCQTLEAWLREDFLPRLPEDALVIVAGRNQPSASWRTDPSWAGALRAHAVRDFGPADAVALLRQRGVPAQLHESVLAFAGGHPLALSLAAEVASRVSDPVTVFTPARDVIETLLAELVGTVPSPTHRLALQVCAHAHSTTEELLRMVIPRGNAGELFRWLRGLPYVEAGGDGIYPHDVVRDALEMDLRWRDPTGYADIHRRVRGYTLSRLVDRKFSGVEAGWAASALRKRGLPVPDIFSSRRDGVAVEVDAQPADYPEVVAMAGEVRGVESARITAFWLARQPAAFRIFRHRQTGELLAFASWLKLTEPVADEIAADPVVAAAWDHSLAFNPPRPGEHIAVTRGIIRREEESPTPLAQDIGHNSELPAWTSDPRLAHSFAGLPDPELWQPLMDYLGQVRLPSSPMIDGQATGIFAHDWRLRHNSQVGGHAEPLARSDKAHRGSP